MTIVTDPTTLDNKTFDYIVVGGGTSGVTLAARLASSLSAPSVLVLEAGGDHTSDPKIDVPAQWGGTFMDPKYDWAFKTVAQPHSNGNAHVWARGKGLGGSSAMNFFVYSRPPAADVDAIAALGNGDAWGWKEFERLAKRAERYTPAVPEVAESYPHDFDDTVHGFSTATDDNGKATNGTAISNGVANGHGHAAIEGLGIEVTPSILAHTVDAIWQETLVNKGVKAVRDPCGGDVTGTFISPATVDHRTWKRSYAKTGYLDPLSGLDNLSVLTHAYATRLIFADERDASGNLAIAGVEYVHGPALNSDGAADERVKRTAIATKEVVLSAGAIKSPHILELSGIGQPERLSALGIDPRVDLPGVGENVQEHHFMWLIYELDTSAAAKAAGKGEYETLDRMFEDGFAAESMRLHSEGKGMFRTGITSFAFLPLSTASPEGAPNLIDKLEEDLRARREAGTISPTLWKQYELQLAALRNDALPDMEFIVIPGYFMCPESQGEGRRFMTIIGALNHPFSRGTIHAKSNNALENPEIDANYFANEFDLKVLVEHFQYIRTLPATEPFKSCTVGEVKPGPQCASEADIENYIKDTHITTFHTIGSCSMLPREDGGVVDPELKVYGTSNLRVADLSIVPLHIAAHTQSTAYVIGEKSAELIKSAGNLE